MPQKAGRKCSICQKSEVERQLIDDAIRAGDSLRAIARRHNVGKDAVRRHASAHVLMDVAAESPDIPLPPELQETHKYNFVQDILSLKARALLLLKQAEDAKDRSGAVIIMSEIRRQIETIIKVALAQRELEQRDLDKEEMEAGIREVSPDVLEVIRRGIETDELEDVDYDVVEDLADELGLGGNGDE